jgi:hypothetical protein
LGVGPEPPIRLRRGERRDLAAREQLVERITAEFREMPCLRLTPAQAERLFGLRSDIGARVIGELVRSGVLRLDEDRRYAATC